MVIGLVLQVSNFDGFAERALVLFGFSMHDLIVSSNTVHFLREKPPQLLSPL